MMNYLKKIALILLTSNVIGLHVWAQADADPEIMSAMLESTKASKTVNTSSDPLEALLNDNDDKSKVEIPKKKEEIKKIEEPKKITKKVNQPIILTKEETDLLDQLDSSKIATSLNKESEKNNKEKVNKKQIYVPAPVEEKSPSDPVIERDSSKIRTVAMGVKDVLNLNICFNGGLTITLDQSIDDEISKIYKDDNEIIAAEPSENNRGVYVHLTREIEENKQWESAIRLYRKSDDKVYLINLVAVSCPRYGLSPFPKVVYIKDRPGLIGKNSKVLTPEDTIIELSKAYPRIPKNRITIHDIVADAGSEWTVFGLEVQLPANVEGQIKSPKVIVLDNLQINKIPSTLEYLPNPSKKATETRGVSTIRYNLNININKNYILNNRYIHVMYLDEEGQYYQYIRVDTQKFFFSLLKRGYKI